MLNLAFEPKALALNTNIYHTHESYQQFRLLNEQICKYYYLATKYKNPKVRATEIKILTKYFSENNSLISAY